MRLHLKVYSPGTKIPFDHQHLMVGAIHKWLGAQNPYHGHPALYSFSNLKISQVAEDGFVVQDMTEFFISSCDNELLRRLLAGIQADPELFHGLRVDEVILLPTPDLSSRVLFYPASPILIKRRIGDRIEHVLYKDPEAGKFLKETLLRKMKQAGRSISHDFQIHFDAHSPRAKTRLVNYRGISNRASICPVVILGSNEVKQFAWEVGLGNSTGIGFGAIK